MMVLEPLHLVAVGTEFSHAYVGAVRHAVTVGFISQMIVGVGAHIVNRMRGVPQGSQASLWPTFLLLNLGNAGRVALEVGTDYSPAAFLPMGATGFVELTGIAIWGFTLLVLLVRPASRLARSSC
jgi:hypothetical protein